MVKGYRNYIKGLLTAAKRNMIFSNTQEMVIKKNTFSGTSRGKIRYGTKMQCDNEMLSHGGGRIKKMLVYHRNHWDKF